MDQRARLDLVHRKSTISLARRARMAARRQAFRATSPVSVPAGSLVRVSCGVATAGTGEPALAGHHKVASLVQLEGLPLQVEPAVLNAGAATPEAPVPMAQTVTVEPAAIRDGRTTWFTSGTPDKATPEEREMQVTVVVVVVVPAPVRTGICWLKMGTGLVEAAEALAELLPPRRAVPPAAVDPRSRYLSWMRHRHSPTIRSRLEREVMEATVEREPSGSPVQPEVPEASSPSTGM